MLTSRVNAESQYAHFRKELGAFIKRARIHRGFSQYALARALGFETAQFISNFERGVALVPVHHVHSIARELKVDVEVFADRFAKIEYWRVMEGVPSGS